MRIFYIAFLTGISFMIQAAPIQSGNFYTNTFCDRFDGKKNINLKDGSRVDCQTDSHVIEIENAYKWDAALGRTLYNATVSGKKGGVVLIMKNPNSDKRYLDKLVKVTRKYKVYVWVIYNNGEIKGIR